MPPFHGTFPRESGRAVRRGVWARFTLFFWLRWVFDVVHGLSIVAAQV